MLLEGLDETAEVQLRKHRLPAPVALAGRIALALPALAAPQLVQESRAVWPSLAVFIYIYDEREASSGRCLIDLAPRQLNADWPARYFGTKL